MNGNRTIRFLMVSIEFILSLGKLCFTPDPRLLPLPKSNFSKLEMRDKTRLQEAIRTVVCVMAIFVVGISAYSNSMRSPFLFDDIGRIVEEPSIRTLWPPSVSMQASNRPFAQYTFAINYAIHALDVWGYHAGNLGIHLASALFLFGFAVLTLKRCEPRYQKHRTLFSLSIALIWVAHPLNTQAVTYIIQRLESLMGLAFLATLFCFAVSQTAKVHWPWLLLSILACAFGMGCKEVMVSAPLVILWYDRAFVAGSWSEIFSKRSYFYLLMAATWGVLAWCMLHYQQDYASGTLWVVSGLTSWTYLLSQSTVLLHYLSLAIWPVGQCVYPAWPISHSIQEVYPQFFCMSVLFGATLWATLRRPKWGFLGGCFFLILAPTSSVIPIKDLAFEHRMYLPLAACVAIVAMGSYELLLRLGARESVASRWHLGASLAITFVFGLVTFERNKVYESEISVWKDTLVKSPRNVTVWVGLAGLFAKEKRFDEAKAHFTRAIEIAPDDAIANANFAGMLIELKEYDRAGQLLERAFQSDPNCMDAIVNMAHLQMRLGDFAEAAKYYSVAAKGRPRDEALQSCLVTSLIGFGNSTEAERISLGNLGMHPFSARANVDYASALIAGGNSAQAVQYCEKAISIDDNLAAAHATLAMLESTPDKAIMRMKKAIELEPASCEYNRWIADQLLSIDPLDAVRHLEIALQSEPNNIELLLKLGSAWDAGGRPEKGLPYLEKVTRLLPDWSEAREILEQLRRAIKNP